MSHVQGIRNGKVKSKLALALFVVPLIFLSLAVSTNAQEVKKTKTWQCSKTRVKLDLTLLPKLRSNSKDEGWWYGDYKKHEWTVNFVVYPIKEYGLSEPAAVLEFLNEYRSGQEKASPEKRIFFNRKQVIMSAGYAPFVMTAQAKIAKGKGRFWVLAGVTREHGYSIEITVEGKTPEGANDQITKFFETGVSFDGAQWNPQWTDEELESYWNSNAPDGLQTSDRKKVAKFIRTKHYVILTNSSGGKLFAKKMEQCYTKIKKTFPFKELAGRRLMPVLLFRTDEEYVQFYMKKAKVDRASAEASKGHAWLDYYSTCYDSPDDPVHIHEATHQIFLNRLFLSGGGSWFQEGVAEFMCESKTKITSAARRSMRGKYHPPLRKFMKIESLIDAGTGKRGEDLSELYYLLAGSLITCVRESKWGKDKFMDFIHAIGSCPDNDLPAIEGALKSVYGFGIDELEARWKKHFK